MRKLIYFMIIITLLIITSFLIQCGAPEDEHNHSHNTHEAISTSTNTAVHDNHDHSQELGDHEHEEGEDQHKSTESADTHSSSEEEHASDPGHRHVVVSPDIIKQWGIKYTKAGERDYVETVSLTGVVKENQENTYIINALVPGTVVSIKKDIGNSVQKGDVLCVLNSPELLELKTNYIKASQEFRLNKENYDRAIKLFDIKGIEQKELIGRESAFKTAMAEYFSLEAGLSTICSDKKTFQIIKEATQRNEPEKLKSFLSPFYNIISPGAGKVMMRDLRLGEQIDTSHTIFEISDTRHMWVILDALEKDLPYIDEDKNVRIETDVYPGEYFSGRVLNLDQKINPELRTLKVRVEVTNPEGRLKPEMYVRGILQKELARKQIAVPEQSLVKLSGVDGVFIYDRDEFLFKAVQVIETDSEGFAFVNGLKPGDLVVSEGAFYLKAEYEIRSGKIDPHAGHNH